MTELPTLYQYDKKGRVRQWRTWADGDTVFVEHGMQGGKLQVKTTKCKAKNVGKANATTPEEQAVLESKAKWVFQIQREDYAEDVEESGKQLRPMLALDYTKVPHRVNFENAYGQPKLDGLRLIVGRQRIDENHGDNHLMMTRKGEQYQVPHLVEPTMWLLHSINTDPLVNGRCLGLDGEAYLHGLPLQTITSYARKYQSGKTETLEFHLFDLIIPGMSFENRYSLLWAYLGNHNYEHLDLVPSTRINDKDHLKQLHDEYAGQGYEGIMIRHGHSEYEIGDRSPHLFKYKEFLETEVKIVDMWEDLNQNAMWSCVTKDGHEIDVTPKRTHKERKEMLLNPDQWIGQWVTIKYQQETVDGKPQFAVGLGIRECDDEGNPIV